MEVAFELLMFFAPYILCAAGGAYLEAKFGGKALAELAKVKAELAALKARLP